MRKLFTILFLLLVAHGVKAQATLTTVHRDWTGDVYMVTQPIDLTNANFNVRYDMQSARAYRATTVTNTPVTNTRVISKKPTTYNSLKNDYQNFRFTPTSDFWNNEGIFDNEKDKPYNPQR